MISRRTRQIAIVAVLGAWGSLCLADIVDSDEDPTVEKHDSEPVAKPPRDAAVPSGGPPAVPPSSPATPPSAAKSSKETPGTRTERKPAAKARSGNEPVQFESRGLKGLREKGVVELQHMGQGAVVVGGEAGGPAAAASDQGDGSLGGGVLAQGRKGLGQAQPVQQELPD